MSSKELTKWKTFMDRRGKWKGVSEECIVSCKVTFLLGKGSIKPITFLVLMRNSRMIGLKLHFWKRREAEIAIWFGIKSWFADLVLSTSDSILDWLFLF